MHLNAPLTVALLFGVVASAATTTLSSSATATLPTAASTDTAVAIDQLDDLAFFAAQQANSSVASTSSKNRRGACTLSNLAIRKEWGSLSASERKAYTNAVLCLQAKQAKTPSTIIPGARSRFDDFVGTHINQTLTIHFTGTFLTWHRYFTWSYEQALRNECGYTGYQPYWNWAKTAQTGVEKSPVFDGSDTSISGNGAYVAGEGNVVLSGLDLPELVLPHGTGGGCVTSGPFVNMSVNLGPVALALTNGSTISNGNGLSYNPRCLKRDLTTAINQRFANATSVVSLILKPKEIYDFEMTMQGVPGSGEIGVHGGGHYTIGGDPGRDVFVSPGDPAFYLHHGMIDRTWWIWQMLDPSNRINQVSGTDTFLNIPPSANTTLDTPIDLGYAAGPAVTVRDLVSTTAGPFCYIYL